MSTEITLHKTFQPNGLIFGSSIEAENYIDGQGWSIGGSQRTAPRGIYCGDASIAKWRNLTATDRQQLDGELRYPDGDSRTGSVEIWMKERP